MNFFRFIAVFGLAFPFSGLGSVNIVNPYRFSPPLGAPTYLLSEDMEGVGTPATPVWVNGGTVDWDYTAAPILGAESWSATTGNVNFSHNQTLVTGVFADTSPAYMFFAITVGAPSGDATLFRFYNGSTEQGKIIYRSTGLFRLHHGTATGDSSVLGAGTYYIWIRYALGSGANGEASMWISANQTKPGSPNANILTGTSTLAVNAIRMQGFVNRSTFDKLRVDDVEITSNPN